ncbi:hypothetical protein [Streptomyces sp. NPDC040750]|uniref:COG1470 family protein n=1 Tax=Streptomyces sp. NPDC040750 TaxID=3154491 RepID=UPI00340CC9A0
MASVTRVPPRRRRLPPAAAVPAALCLLTLLGAAPGAAAGSWSVSPSGGGRPSLYAEGPPGAVLRDTVSVTNPGRAPLDVRLSGTGAGIRIAFADRGPRVPARTRADVPITVTVPAGAEPGDRSGAVVARAADGRTATVPLRLRVVGPALAALTVEHLSVRADRLTYELVNRGTTVLVPRLAVRVDGVLGRLLDRPARALPVRLRPGARVRLAEPWPDRPALDAVDVRLTVTAPGGAHDTATTSARFVPWEVPAGAAGTAVVGAGVLFAVRRRGSRTTNTPRPAAPSPGAPGPRPLVAAGDYRAGSPSTEGR